MRVLLLLALVSTPVCAETLWVHAGSKHWNGREYNEFNPGIGLEVPVTRRWSLELGGYKNSFSQPTKYVWGGYALHSGDVRVRVLGGVADGYGGTDLEEGQAIGVVGVSLEYKRARVTLLPGALGFSFKAMEW